MLGRKLINGGVTWPLIDTAASAESSMETKPRSWIARIYLPKASRSVRDSVASNGSVGITVIQLSSSEKMVPEIEPSPQRNDFVNGAPAPAIISNSADSTNNSSSGQATRFL